MDLHSGLAYWIVKNELFDYFNPLNKDIKTEVAIIGSGITGSLISHELCKAGIKCCIIDKRTLTTGSSAASTALLQYEIDVPLHKMSKMVSEENAVLAYRACLKAISDLEKVYKEIKFNPDFNRVPSIFYASTKKDVSILEKEFEIRRKYDLPVSYLTEKEIKNKFGFKAPGALLNNESAQMDAYLGAVGLLIHHMRKKELDIFTHTEVEKCIELADGYELTTSRGSKIKCKYVVIAAGFEAGKFLPKEVMKLTSTYALISQPMEEKHLWADKSLIWETQEPYIYIRTTPNNRIIVGGEDEEFKDPVKRDDLLRKKTSVLEKKFKKLFPTIPFVTDMSWCGTFSSTKDGLPFIGTWPGKDKMFFALGYGGNGITFSMNAAQMLRNRIEGKEDKRFSVFGFERHHKK